MLTALLAKRGWSQNELARRVDVDPTFLSRALRGARHKSVSGRLAARIAKELQIVASTLASRAALEAIVRSRPRTVDEIMESAGLLRWQAELVQGAVEVCLHSA